MKINNIKVYICNDKLTTIYLLNAHENIHILWVCIYNNKAFIKISVCAN